jgi:hypothetical protein
VVLWDLFLAARGGDVKGHVPFWRLIGSNKS